ncbi:PAS domain S-box protein [Lentilitoribacter sp. Alg239-R112]|uniref:PAS domain S-box protein n=1 Tax=Lentilitoribacter sp. Alg239-R112 TaxID=2305987 RepID=UPI0013A6C109|nr:PAS domain S-box protein [Lentilitoribacter sp. Alg239-R112]
MPDRTHKVAKLDVLLEAAVDAIITINADGIVQSNNKASNNLFGYSGTELVGQNIKCLMSEHWASEHQDYIDAHFQTGENRIIGIGRDVQGKRKDGSVFPMHLSVSKYEVDGEVFFTGIIHDLTRRKQSEEALARSQKMEAIGQLTGGIAHDFNNLLTVIIGNLELVEMQMKDKSQLKLINEAQVAAESGADLIMRLLTFARKSVLQPQQTDLNGHITSMLSILSRTIGSDLELKTKLAEDLWSVKVDPGQFESAVINLAVNARDAMKSSGELFIETSNAIIDDKYLAKEAGIAEGQYVRISVSDTGEGMDAKTIEHVFEPFFTTKVPGKGTGLGLSMVHGFAKQSGGHVTVYSELGLGSTVNIYLPRGEQGYFKEIAKRQEKIQNGNGQLILVVEDDLRVQRLTVERLEALNYRTVTADNGKQAIELLEQRGDIRLVFTDLVMPGGVSGYELAGYVGEKFPDLAILMTSGYAEDLVHADELTIRSINLLRKPYKLNDLAHMLRELLV